MTRGTCRQLVQWGMMSSLQPDEQPTAPSYARPLGRSSRSQVPDFQVMTILGRVAELRAAQVHASGRALNYTLTLGIAELRIG